VNALSLLKSLAPGFIPLFAYIAAELLFGETIGLAVGLGIGILEFLFILAKDRKADLFIVADTLLLAAMGTLSLFLRNQIFFRLKPALIEGLMAVAMAALLLLPKETMKAYMGHQIRGFTLEESHMPMLRRSLILMVSVLVLHTGFTVWAALAASTAMWGFVSGGLLYIMLGLTLAGQWITLRGGKKAGGNSFTWCLLIIDETGRIYAGKTTAIWDSPARGEADGTATLETGLKEALSRLGIGCTSAAVAGFSLAVRPAFMLDSDGSMEPLPASRESIAFPECFASMKPGAELVLAAVVPLAAFPKGIDPTERRLLSLADLEALAAMSRLAPAFVRELRALATLRHPLRGESGASIVSDTNDAVV
jgi:intracellular septation protein A